MSHSLIVQTKLASQFIEESWQKARTDAEQVMQAFDADFTEIHIAGCGDSFCAGYGLELAFNTWTERVTHAGTSLKVGRYRTPELRKTNRKALVIGISVSGEVARTIEVIDLANQAGAVTLCFTSDPNSTLAAKADAALTLSTPDLPHGPGLLGYLGSLLMGYAVCLAMASAQNRNLISKSIEMVPDELELWISKEQAKGITSAERVAARDNVVIVGAGPDHGSAMFSAAKIVEACGVSSWGQDLEEWAHIEYFSEPSSMPTWLLSATGRSYGRELEIENAAKSIGRQIVVSRWGGWPGLNKITREAISPLLLWVGPTAYAAKLAEILGEEPFRGFGGGRSEVEGGGVSRIRSSARVESLNELIG